MLSTIENTNTDDNHTNVGNCLSILANDDDDDDSDGSDGSDNNDDTYNVALISCHNVNYNNHSNVFY